MRIILSPKSRPAAHRAIDSAPDGYEQSIVAPSKTREQEEAYHAIFGEVAKQCKHLNECLDAETWKRLLLDQFRRDMLAMPDVDPVIRDNLAHAVKMRPSLDGSAIVAVGLQSRNFRRKTAYAFLEWLNAFASMNDVKLSVPSRME